MNTRLAQREGIDILMASYKKEIQSIIAEVRGGYGRVRSMGRSRTDLFSTDNVQFWVGELWLRGLMKWARNGD